MLIEIQNPRLSFLQILSIQFTSNLGVDEPGVRFNQSWEVNFS